jgi:hypothetical protein
VTTVTTERDIPAPAPDRAGGPRPRPRRGALPSGVRYGGGVQRPGREGVRSAQRRDALRHHVPGGRVSHPGRNRGRPVSGAARRRRRLHGDPAVLRSSAGEAADRPHSASARCWRSKRSATATRSCSCILATPVGASWRSTCRAVARTSWVPGCRPGAPGRPPGATRSCVASPQPRCSPTIPPAWPPAGRRSSSALSAQPRAACPPSTWTTPRCGSWRQPTVAA